MSSSTPLSCAREMIVWASKYFTPPAASNLSSASLLMDKKIIFKTFEGLLIGKSAVCVKNNGYFLWKSSPDKSYNVSNWINIIGSVIWMSTANSENHIDQVRTPANMQRLDAFLFLIGRLTTFPIFGVIVIHYHGIDSWNQYLRFFNP